MKYRKHHHKIRGVSILAALVLNYLSCKNSVETGTDLGNSHLLLVNSAASSSAINLYWNGNKLNPVPLVYSNTTGYKNITSGVREVQIKSAFSNTLLTTNSIRLVRDSSYTFFVFDYKNITTTVIAADDLSAPSFGNAKVKFVNMSSGLSSADLLISNGPAIASSISFGTIGSYAEIKAGTYNLALYLHGSKNMLLNIPNVRVDNGKIYTIWSGGTVNGTGAAALSTQVIVQ